MEPILRENASLQMLLLCGLGGLVILSVLRPKLGLSVSSVVMVLLAVRIYADVGPTSWHLTTAAVCLVGGLLCAGLAGLASLLEVRVARQVPQPKAVEDFWHDQWDEYPIQARAPASPSFEPRAWAPSPDTRFADAKPTRMQGGSWRGAPQKPAPRVTGV